MAGSAWAPAGGGTGLVLARGGRLTEGAPGWPGARAATSPLDDPTVEGARAAALITEGQLATLQGDEDDGLALTIAGLRLAEASGEAWWVAYARYVLSFTDGRRGRRADAIAGAEEALARFRARRRHGASPRPQPPRAELLATDDADGAEPLLEEALARWRVAGNIWGAASTLATWPASSAPVANWSGRRALYRESIDLCRDQGDRWA